MDHTKNSREETNDEKQGGLNDVVLAVAMGSLILQLFRKL